MRFSIPTQLMFFGGLYLNSISLLWDIGLQGTKVYSDTSGTWGCGAHSQSKWFQVRWTPRLAPLSTAVKELIPVVISAATLGCNWGGQAVEFVVDNSAIVDAQNATFSSNCHLMHLNRLVFFLHQNLTLACIITY